MKSQIFVNLPVRDLKKTKEFFTALGFTYNPKFTDDNAACMIVDEGIYVMLLVEEFFKTFTPKEIVDARKSTEVLTAISVDKREKVDELFKRALSAGGKYVREPENYEWMYSQSFQDLDGHIWEFVWMDEGAAQNGPPQ